MARITLQILDGMNRGQLYREVPTPVTIGREEGNTILLNDERVSRFHLKIQEDHDKIVLTDLESTNGTKVNGDEVQIRLLRVGDIITVGKSVILFGSREDISKRMLQMEKEKPRSDPQATIKREGKKPDDSPSSVIDNPSPEPAEYLNTLEALYESSPPALPPKLSPAQAAQLMEILDYFHFRLQKVIDSGKMPEGSEQVTMEPLPWQKMLLLQTQMAEYLRRLNNS